MATCAVAGQWVAVTFAARLPFNHRHGNQSICIINHRAHRNTSPSPPPPALQRPRGGGGWQGFSPRTPTDGFTAHKRGTKTSDQSALENNPPKSPLFWGCSPSLQKFAHTATVKRLMVALMKVRTVSDYWNIGSSSEAQRGLSVRFKKAKRRQNPAEGHKSLLTSSQAKG